MFFFFLQTRTCCLPLGGPKDVEIQSHQVGLTDLYTFFLQTFQLTSRKRRIILFGAFIFLAILYVCYWPSGHHQAVAFLVRNRFINQVFHRAPELNATDLTNTSLLLYWTPFFQNVAFDGFGRKPFAKCPVRNHLAI